MSSLKNMHELISSFTTWILITLSVIAIYESVKQIALGNKTVTTYAILCICVVFLMGRAGFVYYGYSNITDTLNIMNEQIEPQNLKKKNFPNLTDSQFSERTSSLASFVFVNSGEIINYINNSGVSIKYSPNEEEIRKRETRVRQSGEMRVHVVSLLTQAYFLIIAMFTAIFTGYTIAINALKKREANKTLQSDR